MAKMWAGRFQKVDEKVNDFNSSIKFDARMYRQDIEAVLLTQQCGETGIIDATESKAILIGLEGILADIESGKLEFDPTAEDIHMFIEAELTKRIGDAGKRLHTARSRNDQVALDIIMYLKTEFIEIEKHVCDLLKTLCKLAEENMSTIMPG